MKWLIVVFLIKSIWAADYNPDVLNTRIIHQRMLVIGRLLTSMDNDSEVLPEAKRELSTSIKVFSSPGVPYGVIL